MTGRLLIHTLRLDFTVQHQLSEPEDKVISRILTSRRFESDLRKAIREVCRQHHSLVVVRLSLTR